MDVSKLPAKQLKALIDGHKDGLFKEYVLIRPLKQCRGIKAVSTSLTRASESETTLLPYDEVEVDISAAVVEIFGISKEERERIGEEYGVDIGVGGKGNGKGVTREKLEVTQEEVRWLSGVIGGAGWWAKREELLRLDEHEGLGGLRDKEQEKERMYLEFPIFSQYEPEICGCTDAHHQLPHRQSLQCQRASIAPQKTERNPAHSNSNSNPILRQLKAPFVRPKALRGKDDGIAWSNDLKIDVKEWVARAATRPGAGEKLEMDVKDFKWLQATIAPPKADLIEDFYGISLDEDNIWSAPSPILLPLAKPLSPLRLPAVVDLKGLFSPIPEEPPGLVANGITTELLNEDGGSFLISQRSTMDVDTSPRETPEPISAYPELKVETPLVQRSPLSEEKFDIHEQLRLERMQQFSALCLPLEELLQPDEEKGLMQQIAAGGYQFRNNILQEQLQDDEYMRVEVPILPHPRNLEYGKDNFSLFELTKEELIARAGGEFRGVKAITMGLVNLHRWLRGRGYHVFQHEEIEGVELVVGELIDVEEAARAEEELVESVKWLEPPSTEEEEVLVHDLPEGNQPGLGIQETTLDVSSRNEDARAQVTTASNFVEDVEIRNYITSEKRKAASIDDSSKRMMVKRHRNGHGAPAFLASNLLRGGNLFSAEGSLNTFMALRNIEVPRMSSSASKSSLSPTHTNLVPSTPSTITTILNKHIEPARNEPPLRADGVPFPPLPDFIFNPLPPDLKVTSRLGPCFCMVSVTTIPSYRLLRAISQLSPPQLRFIERDFGELVPQPDITITTDTGLFITTMQHIRQPVLLPGEKAIAGVSEFRRRVTACAGKFANLWIVVEYPMATAQQHSGMSERDDKAWKEFVAWTKLLADQMVPASETSSYFGIRPLLVPDRDDVTTLATVVCNILIHENVHQENGGIRIPEGLIADMGSLDDAETDDEILLRLPPVNFNPYTAYVFAAILARRYNPQGKLPQGALAQEFVELDEGERERIYCGLMGGG